MFQDPLLLFLVVVSLVILLVAISIAVKLSLNRSPIDGAEDNAAAGTNASTASVSASLWKEAKGPLWYCCILFFTLPLLAGGCTIAMQIGGCNRQRAVAETETREVKEVLLRDHKPVLTPDERDWIMEHCVPASGFGVEVAPSIGATEMVTVKGDQKLVLVAGGFNKSHSRGDGDVEVRWGSRSRWIRPGIDFWRQGSVATTVHVRGTGTFEIVSASATGQLDDHKVMRLRLKAQLGTAETEVHVVPTHANERRVKARYIIEFLNADGSDFVKDTNPDLKPKAWILTPSGLKLPFAVRGSNLAQFDVPKTLPAGSTLVLHNPAGGICGILCQVQ